MAQLKVYQAALALTPEVISLCRALPVELRSQVRRAMVSVALNIAEGGGRAGRDRQHHFRIAYASAREVSAGLEIGAAVTGMDVIAAEEKRDRVRAMLWRLSR